MIVLRALALGVVKKKNATLTHQKVAFSILTHHFTVHHTSNVLFFFHFI